MEQQFVLILKSLEEVKAWSNGQQCKDVGVLKLDYVLETHEKSRQGTIKMIGMM